MSSIACRCGNLINASRVPTPELYLFVNDSEFETMTHLGADAVTWMDMGEPYRVHEVLHDAVMGEFREFYKCTNCGRLIVYWARDGEPSFYSRDNAGSQL
jgi:hypothetical protein